MSTIMTTIKRQPVLTYLALVFGIPWGAFFILVGPSGIPGTGDDIGRLMPLLYTVTMVSVFMSGILLTGLVDGRAGLRDLVSRLLRWRVGVHWYAVAVLTAPILATAALVALSMASPDFLPLIYTTDDKTFVLQFGIVTGLMAGVIEEFGWTGFAIPTLRRHYGLVATGLIVGLAQGAQNALLVNWTSAGAAGSLPSVLYLPAVLFTWIPAYRVLMVSVYDRTNSLLVAILMHTSLIAFWYILTPHILAGAQLVAYYVLFAVLVYLVTAAVLRSPMRHRPGEAGLAVPEHSAVADYRGA